MAEENEVQEVVEETAEPRIDYFPGATYQGKIFNINGMLWLVREHVKVVSLDKEEYGWHANSLMANGTYHFFTESEIKEQHLIIQEFA